MESIIGLYKVECVPPGPFHIGPFKTLSEVEFATMAWSTGTTTDAYTPPSACAHPPSTRPPTTLPPLPSNRSHSPYEDGIKPITAQADSVWICQLVEHGLVRPSFVPPKPIWKLRDLTRYRKALIQERTREAQRLQKVLEDAGSSWARSPATCWACPAGRCWTRWS